MRMSKLILVCVCLAGVTQLVWSQNGSLNAAPVGRAHGIPGYLDPRTGTFSTKVQADAQSSENPELTPAVATEVFGVWYIQLTISLYTTPASGDIVVCGANLDVGDTYPAFGYEEEGATQATVSGSTATCTVTIPYLWYLATPKTDMVTVTYDVSLYHAYTVGTATQANISRTTSHTIGSYAVPGDGVHTTTAASPRI
jgi:hypothetical protein